MLKTKLQALSLQLVGRYPTVRCGPHRRSLIRSERRESDQESIQQATPLTVRRHDHTWHPGEGPSGVGGKGRNRVIRNRVKKKAPDYTTHAQIQLAV